MPSAEPQCSSRPSKVHHLLSSIVLHLLLVLMLSPGHEEEHTVQLFKGVIELGESGDGHAERPHLHTPKQRKSRPAEDTVATPAALADEQKEAKTQEISTEPIDVASPGGTGALGGSAGPLNEGEKYLLEVLRRVQRSRTYPRESLLREEEGDVTVALTIAPDGKVQALELAKPCPFEALNRAALESIRAAGPFAPLPSVWNRAIRVRIPIHYELRDG
jgi:TonB family protein